MKGSRKFKVAGVIALAVMMMFILAACGDESDEAQVDEIVEKATEQSGGGEGKIDACDIVTEETATELFGQPASPEEGTPVIDPNMLGECLWTWDTEMSNQLLQFRVWNGDVYYGMPGDAEPYDIGEQGYIRVNELAGIDISWVQDGKTVEVSYFNIGPDAPPLESKVEEMKDLAKQVEGEL